MIRKQLLVPDRVRTIPPGFGWVDRRVLREGHFDPLDSSAILLYYFLTTVADVQGLSFWADPTVSRFLKIPTGHVVGARDRLLRSELLAYRHPLYQVLSLPSRPRAASPPPTEPSREPTASTPCLPQAPRRGGMRTGRALFDDAIDALRHGGGEGRA